MVGGPLVRKAAKKGKKKYGYKGLIAAGAVALVGRHVAKKKLRKKVT